LRIEINGEARDVPENLTLETLLAYLDLNAPERIAVEHNRRVARRAEWTQTKIEEGDRIEIVHFVGGGREQVRILR
jgi:sulfur carrier protein